MAYPISDVPRRIVYSGSAGVGPYAFTFEVLANTDIAVYKNTTLLTLTTDYTVSINTGTGTGTVTLVVAATGADTVTIVGDRAIQRTSDFVTGGDLFANTLNEELDAQTIYTQQVDEKADRAIRAPVTDPTTINMVLPSQASRAQKLLGFNASGEPTAYVATTTVSDTSLINFTQAGTGAVTRTVQSKLRESVSPEDFGAVGDGATNDRNAIYNALQYCSDTGVPFKAKGGATYRMTSGATINRTNGKPMLVDWAGATVVCDEASGVTFGNAPSAFLNTTLATQISRGASFIHLTSVAGIAKGDLLEILSPALTSGNVSTYHYYIVNEIDGNNVYIEGTTVADVKNQQIIDSGQVGSITVAAYKVAPMLVVQNATFQITDTTGANNSCLYVRGHNKVIVSNITFTGRARFQLVCDYTGFIDVGSCTFRDFGYVEKNTGYVNLPSSPGGLSFGYGFLTTRNYETLFHDCIGLRGWHTIDIARGAMKTQVSNCFFNRNDYGVGTHEGSWFVSVKGCSFDGITQILAARCAYFTVEGCDFRAMTENGVSYGGDVIEFRANNNRFLYNPGSASSQSAVYDADNFAPVTPKAGAVSTGFPRVFELIGNTIIGQCRCWAGFSGSSNSGRLSVNNNVFRDFVDFRVNAMLKTSISGNEAYDLGGQFMFTLNCGSGNPTVIASNNVHNGGVETSAGSAMFAINGSNTPSLNFYNNSCALEFLIRFDSNLTVTNVIGCTNRSQRLFLDPGTVTNAINNCYKISVAVTTTVTNSVNNNLLT